MSVFTTIWRAIQLLLHSRALAIAVEIALEVIPKIELEAKNHPDWTWRDKHQAAFDEIESELRERGYTGPRYVFIAIEFALQQLGYFNDKD